MIFDASTDAGLTWQSDVSASPRQSILVRARVRLVNYTFPILGLAGVTFQPTLSNWNSSTDTRLPFTSSDGSPVPNDPPSNTGRIFPFGSSSMSATSASGLLTSHVDNATTLRFAGANAATATTNLAWGISTGQAPISIGGTNFVQGENVTVFRYAVQFEGNSPRDLLASVPLSSILAGRASWYRTAAGGSLLAPFSQSTILPATIHYIPTPSPTLTLLAALTLLSPRRRRP